MVKLSQLWAREDFKLTIWLGLALGFLYFNFNRDLANGYAILIGVDAAILIWSVLLMGQKKVVLFPLEKDTFQVKDLALGIIAYIVFVLIGLATLPLVGQVVNLFEQLGANTPLLSNSKTFMVIGWGFLIPLIETRLFFGKVMPFLGGLFKADMKLNGFIPSIRTFLTMIVVSAGFTWFHITAKAAVDFATTSSGLYLTFLFAFISCYWVLLMRELASATWFHIVTNTIAVLVRLRVPFVMSLVGLDASMLEASPTVSV